MMVQEFLRERRVAMSARRIFGGQFPRLAAILAILAFAVPLIMALPQ